MSPRVGIFRRIAVELYMRPIESDVPETLAPARRGIIAIGVFSLLCAGWLLF